MHPNGLGLVVVHQSDECNGRAFLLVSGYSFVFHLGLVQVFRVDQLVPGRAVYLLFAASQVMFATGRRGDVCIG